MESGNQMSRCLLTPDEGGGEASNRCGCGRGWPVAQVFTYFRFRQCREDQQGVLRCRDAGWECHATWRAGIHLHPDRAGWIGRVWGDRAGASTRCAGVCLPGDHAGRASWVWSGFKNCSCCPAAARAALKRRRYVSRQPHRTRRSMATPRHSPLTGYIFFQTALFPESPGKKRPGGLLGARPV